MMNLIPWRRHTNGGESPLSTVRSEVDRLFDRFMGEPWGFHPEGSAMFSDFGPSLDVSESDDEVDIRVELPGVDATDIDLSVCGNELCIGGQKSEARDERDRNRTYSERRFGSFRRVLTLPSTADIGKIAAEHANGVLTIRIPKLEGAKPRRIEVQGGTGASAESSAGSSSSRRVPVDAG